MMMITTNFLRVRKVREVSDHTHSCPHGEIACTASEDHLQINDFPLACISFAKRISLR